MIKANELRIGNWVMFVPDNDKKHNNRRPVQVCEIYAVDGFTTIDNGLLLSFGNEPKEADGIPLTPEVLEKCGFEKHKNSNEFWTFWTLPNNWHFGESHHNEPSAGTEVGKFYWGEEYKEVKSLHQLQNLYFALTGEELPYNT